MGLVENGKMPKSLTWLLNYGRKRSLWMYQWGLACCAIEMVVFIVILALGLVYAWRKQVLRWV